MREGAKRTRMAPCPPSRSRMAHGHSRNARPDPHDAHETPFLEENDYPHKIS